MDHQVAFLFPGVTQYAPQGFADLCRTRSEAMDVLRRVDAVARSCDLPSLENVALCDPPTTLAQLEDKEPAVLPLLQYALALATADGLRSAGIEPHAVAGHSFGELSAFVCAGILSVEDGVRVICLRMRAIGTTRGRGGMLAVQAAPPRVEHLLRAVASPTLAVACVNTPRQSVVSGTSSELDHVERLAAALDWQTVRLSSPYPYHSRLLAGLVTPLREALQEAGVRAQALTTPTRCVFHDRWHDDSDDLLTHIAEMLIRPVRFVDCVRSLYDEGITHVVECGTGDTLTRFVEANIPRVQVVVPLPDNTATPDFARLAAGLRTPGGGAATARLPPVPARDSVTGPAPSAPTSQRKSSADEPAAAPTPAPGPTPRNAPEGAAPSGAAAEGKQDRQRVVAVLGDLYAEITGYPADVFTEDAHVEVELGIDSLRQTRMLAAVAEKFAVPLLASGVRIKDFPTIGHIADAVVEHTSPAAAS
ncbi:acyltransferase domain-containing protein [Streptomyces sp. LP05-1]|uniref:Acyltransferase domain-containing protein n=1 Tax=Streptomyces pyxinae TaxID=2970734 RepID=A0ABT2CBF2_9ACTN|nr:acyltransferase domain-containing protein [Streptomyces sp. LP05-1]MCS0634738.1 acyltransferase domain-containing protein [Streptomyces sp. LP05-1]